MQQNQVLQLLQESKGESGMVKKSYNFEFGDESKIAKAFHSNANCSTKFAVEMAREIKGKRLGKAERFIQRILEKKEHLPLRKYKKKVAHRKGKAKSFTKSGRYPQKTAKVFLDLLRDVKANADYKGLDAENLLIIHAFASKGFRRLSYQSKGQIGGKRRRRKSTHVEIIAREAR